MSTPELTWFRSSYRTNDGPDCVEVATTVHVRHSKQLPTGGPHLGFTPAAWADVVTNASEA
ncbi:DUF397 domain-containing protein [Streptomyces sp. NPDC059171]|uniref:DUF397 domain-containing protein n=1 Tax=unclassified Streptomyces TaxID=2593676 RepID=UPI00368D2129